MSAHRRPGLRGHTPPRRRATAVKGRRRAHSRPYRGLPLVLGITLIALALAGPTVVGTGWNPILNQQDPGQVSLAAVPTDAPELGLVYEGLERAPKGALCAGAYELSSPETCTHGPDPAPAGLKVQRDVPPVTGRAKEPSPPKREAPEVPTDAEIVRDEGGTALAAGAPALVPDAAPGEADFILGTHDVACEGDGHAGKRVQVLYLHEFGTPSRYGAYVGSIRTWAAGVDAIFDASAAETGGSRHVRFVTTPECRVDVAEVQVPTGSLDSFTANITALQRLGYNRTDRKYLVFADTNVYCGIGTFIADRRPGAGNRNNGGPSYGRVDAGCWSAAVGALEVTHMLGAVLTGAPNAVGGRCTDEYDLLCTKDPKRGGTVRTVCPKQHEQRLDCNHDDYFSTDPKPGSYLAKNWNVAQSEFLLRSDGGADVPGVPAPPAEPTQEPTTGPSAAPTVTPPSPEPSASPSPSAGDDGGVDDGGASPSPSAPSAAPSVAPKDDVPAATPPVQEPVAVVPVDLVAAPEQAVLEARDATSTAVRLAWSAASPDATYEVAVDGVTIATTKATRARLIGLRPDTKYQVTVRNAAQDYVAKASAQTVPAARPAQNAWFVLVNSLTGNAADLYAARTATGTPIVLNGSEGGAQQQWRLAPAGADTFFLQSRATGKCIGPQGGNPVAGAPLVQADCTVQDSQRWVLRLTDHGFSLNTTVGDLVVGVGAQRFGAHRLLVLQRAERSRHQSWTALPG